MTHEKYQPTISQDMQRFSSRVTERSAQYAGQAADFFHNGFALIGLRIAQGLGDISARLGMAPQKRINVPEDKVLTAIKYGIPNLETSYLKTPEGKVVYSNGNEVLQRGDTQRMDYERKGVMRYLLNQGDIENNFIFNLLQNPISAAVDRRHQAGVTQVNARHLPPMTNDCRAAVIIPARFEASRIRRTLEGYTKQQGVNPNQFEINVIVNHKDDETPDETTQMVLQFKKDHPELHVNLLDVQFDKSHAKVGYARKLITDTTLARAVKRDGYNTPLYIITADADETKVDPTIVRKTIDGFDRNPTVDCLRGRQDRSSALIAQNDLMALTFKGSQIAEFILRDRKLRDPYRQGYDFGWNRVVTGGWASAFTAEAFAIINGYENISKGEDMTVGELCSLARGHWDARGNLVPFTDATKTFPVQGESNYLRLGNELVTGVFAYKDGEFERQDIKQQTEAGILQKLNALKRINPDDSANRERFEKSVEGSFNFLRDRVGNNSEFLRLYGPRFLFFIGFNRGDYELVEENDEVKLTITNWENVRKALDRNRMKYWDEYRRNIHKYNSK